MLLGRVALRQRMAYACGALPCVVDARLGQGEPVMLTDEQCGLGQAGHLSEFGHGLGGFGLGGFGGLGDAEPLF